MDAKVQKQIIDYFSCFEEFHNTAKSCLKDCQNCAVSINKLIKRCKNIKEAAVIGSPLGEFEGLQSKLCASLHNLISEEIQEIRSKQSTLEDLFDKLCNKNNALRESCKEVDLQIHTPLVKGTPLQPPLQQLLDFAEDTITFGSHLTAQIETSLNVISFKGLNTDCLIENFAIPTAWLKRISEIISFTSFVSENQI